MSSSQSSTKPAIKTREKATRPSIKNNDKRNKITASCHKQLNVKTTDSESAATDSSSSVQLNSGDQTKLSASPDVVLSDFSQATRKIKEEIKATLDKQSCRPQVDLCKQVDKLRGDLIELSQAEKDANGNVVESQSVCPELPEAKPVNEQQISTIEPSTNSNTTLSVAHDESSQKTCNQSNQERDALVKLVESDSNLAKSLDETVLQSEKVSKQEQGIDKSATKPDNSSKGGSHAKATEFLNTDQVYQNIVNNDFKLLDARLDSDSKLAVLSSSLKKNFDADPTLFKSICKKLIELSEHNNYLSKQCQMFESENHKLVTVKEKLSALCRELQKSNNTVRIESLNLIKEERDRAKEQTSKIQSTLSSVIKLFDENQQRNSSLRTENAELQTKLRSLIEHCDNWEKSIEAVLKQRDLESRLLKTELAKANLSANVEREKFLNEKKELLRVLAMMQEQQRKIEAQEARLKSDLSTYANKYDECQTTISKEMGKLHTESNKMLKQLEKSRKDYLGLLAKYETSNKKIKQLLEEKLRWDKTLKASNKKVETLEKLCRALRAGKTPGESSAEDKTTVTETPSNVGDPSKEVELSP